MPSDVKYRQVKAEVFLQDLLPNYKTQTEQQNRRPERTATTQEERYGGHCIVRASNSCLLTTSSLTLLRIATLHRHSAPTERYWRRGPA